MVPLIVFTPNNVGIVALGAVTPVAKFNAPDSVKLPPTFRLPPIPTPPATINAPEVGDVATVV